MLVLLFVAFYIVKGTDNKRIVKKSIVHLPKQKIAWVHIPKCGTSFGNVLVHYANPSLPRNASVGDNEREFQRKYSFEIWFKGTFWEKDQNFGNHFTISDQVYQDYYGHFFCMFRNPVHRAESAYNYFRSSREPKEYARRIAGLAVKQIAGQQYGLSCLWEQKFGCKQGIIPNTDLAIERLKAFAFIGITEYWDLSICLFHLLFGGQCLPIEFQNTRPGGTTNLKAEQHPLSKHNDSSRYNNTFAGFYDKDDWRLYRKALSWFLNQLRLHSVTFEYCQSHCWHKRPKGSSPPAFPSPNLIASSSSSN
mmetsp:Transcript_5156/g.7261  ORF Transcript_5156/g.7261 Transcript_5156/m.7261 type:complete len:307 (-) Transcript_5156:693-1613(-)